MKSYLSRPRSYARGPQFSAKMLLAPMIAAAASLLLAGCQTPATRIQTVEVKVPVATTPLRPDQVPTPPAPLPKRPESLSAAADVLLSRLCQWVAYGLRADPLLRLSAGEKQAEMPAYPECSGE